jgi:hypothetical protein
MLGLHEILQGRPGENVLQQQARQSRLRLSKQTLRQPLQNVKLSSPAPAMQDSNMEVLTMLFFVVFLRWPIVRIIIFFLEDCS